MHPKSFLSLTRLTQLNLMKNDLLSNLPSEVGFISSLQSINISFTKVKKLPFWLKRCSQLTELSLRHTPITSISRKIIRLPSLTELNMRNCYDLKVLPLPPSTLRINVTSWSLPGRRSPIIVGSPCLKEIAARNVMMFFIKKYS